MRAHWKREKTDRTWNPFIWTVYHSNLDLNFGIRTFENLKKSVCRFVVGKSRSWFPELLQNLNLKKFWASSGSILLEFSNVVKARNNLDLDWNKFSELSAVRNSSRITLFSTWFVFAIANSDLIFNALKLEIENFYARSFREMNF